MGAASAINPFTNAPGRVSRQSRRDEDEDADEGDMGMQEKSSRGHGDT